MVKRLKTIGIIIDTGDKQKEEEYDGEIWRYPAAKVISYISLLSGEKDIKAISLFPLSLYAGLDIIIPEGCENPVLL